MSTIATRIAAASVASSIAVLGFGAATGQARSGFDGKSLKAGSVTAGKIRKDTLTGVQIRESTLGLVPIANLANLAKLADNAKTAQEAVHAANADHAKSADTAKNADKAKEADTAKVADDAKALNGRSHTAFLSNSTRTVTADGPSVPGPAGGTPSNVAASCNADEKAIGGGGGWRIPTTEDPTALEAPVTSSAPVVVNGELTGWEVYGRNLSGTNRFLRAYAICVPKSA